MYEKNSRLISFTIAIISAMLVIMAGKGCTQSPDSKKEKNTVQTTTYHEPTPEEVFGNNGNYYTYDQIPTENEEEPTTENVQYVTDLIGRVVGTVPPAETVPAEETETEQVPTVTKSILEEYNERQQENIKGGGFDHGQKNIVTTPPENYQNATFPPDFTVVIN